MVYVKKNLFPVILAALTAAALLIGGWFYSNQLAATPPLLWLFVIDCPLYAALASPMLLFGRPRNPLYRFVVACGLAIYGSWTIFVLLYNNAAYFSPDWMPISIILIIGHLGMILEGLLVLPPMKEIGIKGIFVSIGWFLLNLHLDYFNGALSTHPWIPEQSLPAVMAFTATASLAIPVLLACMADAVGNMGMLEKLRKSFRFQHS